MKVQTGSSATRWTNSVAQYEAVTPDEDRAAVRSTVSQRAGTGSPDSGSRPNLDPSEVKKSFYECYTSLTFV